ncbi:MAG: hypothetical protein II610_03040 [Treponema sp.]|nr:hypothetical protein [Treponema sp.]
MTTEELQKEAVELLKKNIDKEDEKKLRDYLSSDSSYTGKDIIVEKIISKYNQ